MARVYAEAWNFGPKDECVKPVGDVMDLLVTLWPGDVSWVLDSSDIHMRQNY